MKLFKTGVRLSSGPLKGLTKVTLFIIFYYMKIFLTVILTFIFFIAGLLVVLGAMKLCTLIAICGLLGFLVKAFIIFIAACIIVLLLILVNKIGTLLDL